MMRKKIVSLLLIAAVLLFIAACTGPMGDPHEASEIRDRPDYDDKVTLVYADLYRVVDEEYGVVCWVWQDSDGNAVSCLPEYQLQNQGR